MLIALAVGLMLMLAVVVVQVGASTQNMRISDANQRDNEVRAAFDMLTQDVASAGFLLTPGVPNCAGRLNFDSGAPSPNYFATNQVSALASSTGLQLPMATAGTLTMDYPASGSSNRSDVLVISRASDATQYGDPYTPTTLASPNAAYHPMTTGLVPVSSAASLTAGHVALLSVPLGGQLLCLRVPVSSIGTASSSPYMAGASGTLMPSTFYTGFSGKLATVGMGSYTLSDALLMQAKVLDMGTAAASNQVTYVYYVSGSSYTWPTLMRATIDSLNDTVTKVQPIAAGVVSLQVLFGVDTTGSGGVTAYQTGATVATSNSYASIRSVRIGVIARSLYADPSYTAPTTITLPGGSPFTPFTVSASNNRHTALITEVAVRNTLWTP